MAATLEVPGTYPTIQAAINAAVNGDVVEVSPGTYKENIDFLGKAITVTSLNDPVHTVINGGNPSNPDFGSTVTFRNGEGLNSVLTGFTITNGKGTKISGNFFGGGIYMDGSSPTIFRNVIISNTVNHNGGGICCQNGSEPLIEENIISNNVTTQREGGGISSESGSDPLVTLNIFMANYALNDFMGRGGAFYGKGRLDTNMIIWNGAQLEGGAIYGSGSFTNNFISENISMRAGGLSVWSDALVENNSINGNISQGMAGGIECVGSSVVCRGNSIRKNSALLDGGGVLCGGGIPTVCDNTIAGNTTVNSGGGITCQDSNAIIYNNMIYNNEAVVHGGGIDIKGIPPFPVPVLLNNTITMNTASKGGGIAIEASPDIDNCLIWDNTGSSIYVRAGSPTIDFCCVQGGWPGPSNIAIDPLFAGPLEADFHITYNSQCRDNGNNLAFAAGYLPTEDFEDDPRVADGVVDIGADEYHRHLYHTGNASPGGNVFGKFVGDPGDFIFGIWLGSDHTGPTPTPYGPWYLVDPLYFVGPLGTIPAHGILKVPATLPIAPPGPYELPMQALIDNQLTNLHIMTVQ
jgi:parallel beta-helix repeat protein